MNAYEHPEIEESLTLDDWSMQGLNQIRISERPYKNFNGLIVESQSQATLYLQISNPYVV